MNSSYLQFQKKFVKQIYFYQLKVPFTPPYQDAVASNWQKCCFMPVHTNHTVSIHFQKLLKNFCEAW